MNKKLTHSITTIILKIDKENPQIDKIRIAARIIKIGGLVAFPTETVYGLGADALNPTAVSKIFKAKNRPFNDPLIVHIAKIEEVDNLTSFMPDIAKELIRKFWPGPLTLILKKKKIVPAITTASLNTIAVRMPNNKIALSLIEQANTPIAAPSANLFGRPSPTTASHVIHDLNGKIDLIIDGGKTNIGVESTVVDLTGKKPTILRPGGITKEELQKVIGKINTSKNFKIKKSPGMFKRHYSPKAKLILVEGDNNKALIKKMKELYHKFKKENKKVGILITEENEYNFNNVNLKILGSQKNLNLCAKNLFSHLREFDKEAVEVILAEGLHHRELGLAIMDRLRKASCIKIKV